MSSVLGVYFLHRCMKKSTKCVYAYISMCVCVRVHAPMHICACIHCMSFMHVDMGFCV